ncbi:hypothetical protein PR003_g1911 [Phytophthora rubi]|uniref:Uncharacterized protein n=1 Tax=Phytophthora rubi TaxID=129364 RepID=A0A6A3PF11_9STRA|nr:hypothetical protein PR002_g5191 [Phytophthora rubi]KAE9051108.1 hypothetical protein PR001_g1752 [Phytophthora rubi]KAE9357191.1 hypothetical protein PR003_g1911 [Phytophthora rubi]
MQRVAVLSHVKASTVPPSRMSTGVRRIPWQGGKISSNKEEALQKFYQRKLRAGDHLTAQQIKAMQATLGVTQDAQKTPKKQHGAHRSHAKVTASGNRTVLKTGRVLGPKLDSKHQGKKAGGSSNSNSNAKQQAARQPKTVAKTPQKRAETSSSISLEDKLGLPLDALVGGKTKRSSGNMKRR